MVILNHGKSITKKKINKKEILVKLFWFRECFELGLILHLKINFGSSRIIQIVSLPHFIFFL